ncbi:MAG: hybrid sensor histidine kinase/response regulator [SAR324 cluster bacterium]|nr:hybrid sensor histidine kinase/response regulator [SAR324 cluster bacterium]
MLDDEEMLQGFLEETKEHLATIEPDLLSLEEDPDDLDTMNRLFRSVHSIKGGAGFFGLEQLSRMAHVMENLMSQARNGKLVLASPHIDGLLKGLDKLNTMVDDVAGSNDLNIDTELALLEALNDGKTPETQTVSAEVEVAAVETVATVEEAGAPAPIEVAAPEAAPTEIKSKQISFKISDDELKLVKDKHMNLYAVSLYLQRDIMSKGKTPFQFISDLEELGRFIDSYLDHDDQGPIEEGLEDDLLFTFIFASIMEPAVASEGLAVEDYQITNIKPADLISGSLTINTKTEKLAIAPPTSAPVAAPEPVAVATPVTAAPVVATPTPEPVVAPVAATPPAIVPKTPPPKPAKAKAKQVKSDESIRVSVGKLNKLVDLAGELVLVRNQLLQTGEREGKKLPGLMPILQGLNIVTTELQEEILNTRMQPVSTVFGKFPRLIRELGTTLGKEIALIQEGTEVELDKTVLEALSDPLTHIIRNTADHGIETPAERKAAGKAAEGNLLLKAYHESGQVIILVKDDGKGIDGDRIAGIAYERGLITEDDFHNMSNREKIKLIFRPGFSTAEKVSSVSGRGVGMDVVRSNIEMIGGTVELSSVLGEGTTIKMTLPLTMAIVSCLIVESEGERFAIPQINLEELVMLKPEDYKTMLGYMQNKEVLKLRGELLPLVALSEGLGILAKKDPPYKKVLRSLSKEKWTEGTKSTGGLVITERNPEAAQEAVRILIISIGINKVGVIVDSIVGSEEIVVKPMPEYLKSLHQFSGATILGDGAVAMIIDTLGFVQKNNLFFADLKSEKSKSDANANQTAEEQSLLVFDNGTNEQFAITIPLIQRVDEIDLNKIQMVGDKEFFEYRGQQMRLLRLHDYLSIQQPTEFSERASIIVPKETRIPVGIVINKVIDTKNMQIDVNEGGIQAEGILGSTLIDGKITLLLDLYALLEMGEPDALHRVKFEAKTVQTSKILLVEDTPLFLTIVKEYLASVGFDVVTAVDGQEGLDKLEKNHFDLVLSDIEMPVMDGFGLIRAIRAQDKYAELPVLALTSLNDDDTVKSGLNAGFNEWLVKLDKEQILTTINKYLG